MVIREASLVMYKLKRKKNSLYMTVLNFSFTSHYFIKYLSEFFVRTISIVKKKMVLRIGVLYK